MPPLPGSLVMLFNCMLSFLLSLDSFNKSMWFPLYTSYQSTLIDLHSLAGTIFLIYKSSTIFPTTKHIFCGSLLHTQFQLPHLLSTVCVPLFLWLLCQSQPHCISCGTQAKEDNIQVLLRLSSHLILDGLSLLPFWSFTWYFLLFMLMNWVFPPLHPSFSCLSFYHRPVRWCTTLTLNLWLCPAHVRCAATLAPHALMSSCTCLLHLD